MPNTKSEGPYIFSTDEQLRQDLKKAMVDRGFNASKLGRALNIPAPTVSRFLNGRIKQASGNTGKYISWLNSEPIPEKSEPALRAFRSWTLLQDYLVADTAKLTPEVKNAVRTLNNYFLDKAME